MDRIDLWTEVAPVAHEVLSHAPSGETSKDIRARVIRARTIQETRLREVGKKKNSEMSVRDLDTYVPLDTAARTLLNESAEALELSARGYHRVIKIARTIADLENADPVGTPHILEALQYRPKVFLA